MNEESEENTKQILDKANMILSYIFSLFNFFIIIISHYILKAKSNNLKLLKIKLFALIIIDSISSLMYINYRFYFDLFFYELFFSILTSIEFYLFISFIYQIFNTTEISQNSKSLKLINPIQLCVLFLLQIFSYYKFTYLYSLFLIILQRIIIFICIALLYRHLRNAITTISIRLLSKDLQNKKIYYYLKIINLVGLIFMLCNNTVQAFLFMVKNNSSQMYIKIALNSINYGIKYFIFILFEVIIYTLSNSYYKNNTDEIINIYQK
jgi:hypothetical protein